MLKQQIPNAQVTAPLRVLPSTTPVARTAGEVAEDGPVEEVQQAAPVTRTTRLHLPPLLLEWHHYLALLTAPLLYLLAGVGVHLLPHSTRYSDTGALLAVVVAFVLPTALCVLLGWHLRNKRMAALGGALTGAAFFGSLVVSLWIRDAWFPIYPGSYLWREAALPAFLGAAVACLTALYAQVKRGRRTVRDKDRNR